MQIPERIADKSSTSHLQTRSRASNRSPYIKRGEGSRRCWNYENFFFLLGALFWRNSHRGSRDQTLCSHPSVPSPGGRCEGSSREAKKGTKEKRRSRRAQSWRRALSVVLRAPVTAVRGTHAALLLDRGFERRRPRSGSWERSSIIHRRSGWEGRGLSSTLGSRQSFMRWQVDSGKARYAWARATALQRTLERIKRARARVVNNSLRRWAALLARGPSIQRCQRFHQTNAFRSPFKQRRPRGLASSRGITFPGFPIRLRAKIPVLSQKNCARSYPLLPSFYK